MTNKIPSPSNDHWGTWEEDRQSKLDAGLEATADERLTWLQAMLELALESGALPREKDPWGRWSSSPGSEPR